MDKITVVTDELFAKLKKDYDSVKKEGYCGNFEKLSVVMSEHLALLSAETAVVFGKLLMTCCVEHVQKIDDALSLLSDFDEQGNFNEQNEQIAIKIFKLTIKFMEDSVHPKTCIKSEERVKKEFAEKVKNLENPIFDSEEVESFKDMLKKI